MEKITLHSGSFIDRNDIKYTVTFYKKVEVYTSVEKVLFSALGGEREVTVWSSSGNANLSLQDSSGSWVKLTLAGSEVVDGYTKYTYTLSVDSYDGNVVRETYLNVSVDEYEGITKTITVKQNLSNKPVPTIAYFFNVQVVDVDGNPIKGARVTIWDTNADGDRGESHKKGTSTTGSDGKVSITYSSSETFYASVIATGYVTPSNLTPVTSTTSTEDYTKITLEADSESEDNYYFYVQTFNEDGSAIMGGITVNLYNDSDTRLFTDTSDSDGKVEIPSTISGTLYAIGVKLNGRVETYKTSEKTPVTAILKGETATYTKIYLKKVEDEESEDSYYYYIEVIDDQKGNGVSGATVKLYNDRGTSVYSGTTDENGYVSFKSTIRGSSTPSEYDAIASKTGYATSEVVPVSPIKSTLPVDYTQVTLVVETE